MSHADGCDTFIGQVKFFCSDFFSADFAGRALRKNGDAGYQPVVTGSEVPVADVHRSDGIFGRAAGAGTRFRVRVWITNSTAVVAEVSPLLTYGGSRLSCLKRQVSRKNK